MSENLIALSLHQQAFTSAKNKAAHQKQSKSGNANTKMISVHFEIALVAHMMHHSCITHDFPALHTQLIGLRCLLWRLSS